MLVCSLLTNRMRNRVKNCRVCIFNSISIYRARDASLVQFPFNLCVGGTPPRSPRRLVIKGQATLRAPHSSGAV